MKVAEEGMNDSDEEFRVMHISHILRRLYHEPTTHIICNKHAQIDCTHATEFGRSRQQSDSEYVCCASPAQWVCRDAAPAAAHPRHRSTESHTPYTRQWLQRDWEVTGSSLTHRTAETALPDWAKYHKLGWFFKALDTQEMGTAAQTTWTHLEPLLKWLAARGNNWGLLLIFLRRLFAEKSGNAVPSTAMGIGKSLTCTCLCRQAAEFETGQKCSSADVKAGALMCVWVRYRCHGSWFNFIL